MFFSKLFKIKKNKPISLVFWSIISLVVVALVFSYGKPALVLAQSAIQTPHGSCTVEYRAYELIAGAYNIPVKGTAELGQRFEGYALYEYFQPKKGVFSGRKFFEFDLDGGFRVGGNLAISGDRTYLINDKNYKMIFYNERPSTNKDGDSVVAEYFYLEPNSYDVYTKHNATLSKTWSDVDDRKMGPSIYFSKASSRLELPKGFFFSNNIGSKIVKFKTVFKDSDGKDISPAGYIDGHAPNYKNFIKGPVSNSGSGAFEYFLSADDKLTDSSVNKKFSDMMIEPSGFSYKDGRFYIVDRGAKKILSYDDSFQEKEKKVMGGDDWDWTPEAVAIEGDSVDKHILYITDSKNNRVIKTKFIDVNDSKIDWKKEWAKRKESNSPDIDYYTRVFLTGEETMTKVNGLETSDDEIATSTEFTDSSFSGQKVMVTGIPREGTPTPTEIAEGADLNYETLLKYDPSSRLFSFQDKDNALFGKYSYYFPAGKNPNRIVIKNNGSLDLSKDNFVVDFWVKMDKFNDELPATENPGHGTDPGAPGTYVHTFVSQDPVFTFSYMIINGKGSLRTEIIKEKDGKPTAYEYADMSFNMKKDNWYHLSLVREGEEMKMFVNGKKTGNYNLSDPKSGSGTKWTPFGGDYKGYNIRPEKSDLVMGTFVKRRHSHINGWIDNFRFMRGVSNIAFNTKEPVPTYYFDKPTDIVLTDKDYFFVVDKNNGKIVKMKKDFSSWRAYGISPKGEGFRQCSINNLFYQKSGTTSSIPSLFLTAMCSFNDTRSPIMAEIIIKDEKDDDEYMTSLTGEQGYRDVALHLGESRGLFYGNSRFWDKRRQTIYKSYFSDGINGWSVWGNGALIGEAKDNKNLGQQSVDGSSIKIQHDYRKINATDLTKPEQNVSFLTVETKNNKGQCDLKNNFQVAAFDIGYLMERSLYAGRTMRVYFYVDNPSVGTVAPKIRIGLSKKPGLTANTDLRSDNYNIYKDIDINPENKTTGGATSAILASTTFSLPEDLNAVFSDLSVYSGLGRTKDLYLVVQPCNGDISFNSIQVVIEPEIEMGAMTINSQNQVLFSEIGNGLIFKAGGIGETNLSNNLKKISNNYKEGGLGFYGAKRVLNADPSVVRDMVLVNPVDILTIDGSGSEDIVYVLDSVSKNDFAVSSKFTTTYSIADSKSSTSSEKLSKRLEIFGSYTEDGLQAYMGSGGFTVGKANIPQVKQNVKVEKTVGVNKIITEYTNDWTGYHIGPGVSKCGEFKNKNGGPISLNKKYCVYIPVGDPGKLKMDCSKDASDRSYWPGIKRIESTSKNEMNITVSGNGGCKNVPAPIPTSAGTVTCADGEDAPYMSSIGFKADCNANSTYPIYNSSDPKDRPEVPPSECINQWGWFSKWPKCHYFEAVMPTELKFVCDATYDPLVCNTDCGTVCGAWAAGECAKLAPPPPSDPGSPPDTSTMTADEAAAAEAAYAEAVTKSEDEKTADDAWKNGGKQTCIQTKTKECTDNMCHPASDQNQCCSASHYEYSMVCKRVDSPPCFKGNAIRWRRDIRYISIPLCKNGAGECPDAVSSPKLELKVFSGPLYSFAAQNFPRLEKMEKLIKIIEDSNNFTPVRYTTECKKETAVGSGVYIRDCPACPSGTIVRPDEENIRIKSGKFEKTCYYAFGANTEVVLKEGDVSDMIEKKYFLEDLILNSGISELGGWSSASAGYDKSGVANSYSYPGGDVYDLEHYYRKAIKDGLQYIGGGVTMDDKVLNNNLQETW